MILLWLERRGGGKKRWDRRCYGCVLHSSDSENMATTVKPGADNPENSLFLCISFHQKAAHLLENWRLILWVGWGRGDWTQPALFPAQAPSPTFQTLTQVLGTAQHPINFISTQVSQYQLFCKQKLDMAQKQWKVREIKGFLSLRYS